MIVVFFSTALRWLSDIFEALAAYTHATATVLDLCVGDRAEEGQW